MPGPYPAFLLSQVDRPVLLPLLQGRRFALAVGEVIEGVPETFPRKVWRVRDFCDVQSCQFDGALHNACDGDMMVVADN